MDQIIINNKLKEPYIRAAAVMVILIIRNKTHVLFKNENKITGPLFNSFGSFSDDGDGRYTVQPPTHSTYF